MRYLTDAEDARRGLIYYCVTLQAEERQLLGSLASELSLQGLVCPPQTPWMSRMGPADNLCISWLHMRLQHEPSVFVFDEVR